MKLRIPGVAVAAAIAATASWVAAQVGLPWPVVAVVLGAVIRSSLGVSLKLASGLDFSSQSLLRLGVILLGFRLAIADLLDLGWFGIVAVTAVVVLTFITTRWLAGVLGLSPQVGLLVASGYAICGLSAIAAVRSTSAAKDEEVAYAAALVTAFGTLAILLMPLLNHVVGLSPEEFGRWVGASVHDVGQVVAASTAGGVESLEAAVPVKLARVAMLVPLVALLSVGSRRQTVGEARPGTRIPVPAFLVFFVLAVVARTAGWLPPALLSRAQTATTVLIGIALAAMGLGTDLRSLRRIGWRPLVLGVAAWVFVLVVAFPVAVMM